MAIGAEVPQPQPAAIGTGGVGAEMPGGIDLTRPSVGRKHRIGSHQGLGLGVRCFLLTQGTRGLVRETLKRCGLVGVGAFPWWFEQLGWLLRCNSALAGPDIV
jgi:hypothetical protein